jgi:excisionase family DNA binding protein
MTYPDALLTPHEVCQALRISRQTLGRMVDRGDIAGIRLGGPRRSLRIPAGELERILNPLQRKRPAATTAPPSDGSAPTHNVLQPEETT